MDIKQINVIQIKNDKSMRQNVETKKNSMNANLINTTSASFSPLGGWGIYSDALRVIPQSSKHTQKHVFKNPPLLHDNYCEINISGSLCQPLSFCFFFSIISHLSITPLALKWAHLLESHLLGRFHSLVFGGAFCQMIVLHCQPCYRTLQFVSRLATIG